MKIILINPPQTFYSASHDMTTGLPLGIMYIAAVLEKNGYDVEILDALVDEATIRKIGPAKQFGMPWEKIESEIEQRKPDIVGVTCPFSSQVENAVKVTKIVKHINPGIPVIIGGPHVSAMAKKLLNEVNTIDIAVAGEGEYTMLDIARYYEGKAQLSDIAGITYRAGADIVENAKQSLINDLDTLPYPAYHLIEMEKYLNPKSIRYRATQGMREIAMITSRGCPYNCIFCSISLQMGRRWRAHSFHYVLNHIEYLVNNYAVKHVHFEDDNLTHDIRRFEALLDGLIKKNIRIIWDTPNGIRANNLNADIVKKMKVAGCTKLIIGIESGNQYILNTIIDKHLDLQDVVNTAKLCKEVNIPLDAFYLIGFPGEKKANMKRTIDFALMLKKKFNVNMLLSIATPLYGTRLHKICEERGYLTAELTDRAFSEGYQIYGTSFIKTEDFTPDEAKAIAINAVKKYNRLSLVNYLKNPGLAFRKAIKEPKSLVKFIKGITGKY
jgi:anaerobic magnesium-protoporphyrin IX monomethyl ester cyclase